MRTRNADAAGYPITADQVLRALSGHLRSRGAPDGESEPGRRLPEISKPRSSGRGAVYADGGNSDLIAYVALTAEIEAIGLAKMRESAGKPEKIHDALPAVAV